MYIYDNKIILGTALLLNVCSQTILDKKLFKDAIFNRIVIHAFIKSYIQDYCYFSILINNCFSIWCKSHTLNDKMCQLYI